MEILFQTMIRTDSGAGVRHKASTGPPDINAFSKIFDEKRASIEGQLMAEVTESGIPDKNAAEEGAKIPAKPKPDKDEKPDENLAAAAGAMGNQSQVVFILEGDKESATTPEISVDTVTGSNVIVTETTDIPPETGAPVFTLEASNETSKQGAEETQRAIAGADNGAAQPAIVNATDVKNAADTEKAYAADAQETGIGIEGGTGEVTARKPIIRTSEQQENGKNSSEFSNNGDLSPLENENDAVTAKGQKEKTYSGLENDIKKTAGETQEPEINAQTPPLAEGIKPERFQADQQMKQATANAPVRQENLFEEMVSRIETMQSGSRNAMTIQLKPEFLGEVALEIAIDVAGLHVKISAANSDVRGMINSQINTLIESLENKGLEVVEVEVTYTGVNNGAFKENSNNQQAQPDSSRQSYRADRTEDSAAYYAALSFDALDYYLDAGVSSVEYRA